MWFIGVEVEQETSAPRPKKILDPPLSPILFRADAIREHSWTFLIVIQRTLFKGES